MLIRDNFNREGYVVLRKYLSQQIIDEMYSFFDSNASKFWHDDCDLPMYGETFRTNGKFYNEVENVYEKVTRQLQFSLQTYLIRTYHMGRVYTSDTTGMERHVDRAPCHTSITFPVAIDKEGWSINLLSLLGKEVEVNLDVGDILLYKGCDVAHWRNHKKDLTMQYQYYMHWIDYHSEEGEYMRQFSREELQKMSLWPNTFSFLKQAGSLPAPRSKQ